MIFFGKIHVYTCVFVGAFATAGAQTRPDPLGHLVDEALRENLGLRQEQLAERRAQAEVREARGLFLPVLSLESRYSRMEGLPNLGDLLNPAYASLNQLTGSSNFPTNLDISLPPIHETRARLALPLFNAGIIAAYDVARARHEGTRMRMLAAARRLAAETQMAYLQAASARRIVGIYEASLQLVRENERVAGRLVAAGRATPDATHRARAERADVEQQLAETLERERAAVRALNLILNRPLEQPVESVADSTLAVAIPVTLDSAIAHALAYREELRAAEAGERTGRAARRAATASFLPSVALALDHGFQGPEPRFDDDGQFWMGSVVLSWNLLNGGRDRARAEQARADEARARTLRRELEARIGLEVRGAYDAAIVARGAIATADTRLEAARRTFELVRRRYEEGVATPIELVDARTDYTNAQINRVLTSHRYAMRWVDLERAAALREITLPGN